MQHETIEELLERGMHNPEGYTAPPVDYMDDDIIYISSMERLPEVYNSKMHANVLCFVKSGSMEVGINGVRSVINADDVLVCPSNVVVERPLVSPDFKFTVLAFNDRFVQEVLSSNMDVWTRAMYLRKAHVVRPQDDQDREAHRKGAMHFVELMKIVLGTKEMPLHREVMRSLVNTLLLAYCAMQKDLEKAEGASQVEQTSQQGRLIFNKFMHMLNSESRKYQPVQDYASRLNITPKHLTFVCKQVSGKSASEIIQGAVTEEITRNLRNPSLSVKEIASEMGFGNISFFGKYVKTHLGVSPSEYRRRLMAQ